MSHGVSDPLAETQRRAETLTNAGIERAKANAIAELIQTVEAGNPTGQADKKLALLDLLLRQGVSMYTAITLLFAHN